MPFRLGKPILVMLFVAIGAGAVVLLRDPPAKADLTLWSFVELHLAAYKGDGTGEADVKPPLTKFREQTGKTVDMSLVSGRAMDVRLLQLFNSSDTDPALLPDGGGGEMGSIGKFSRPPLDQVGFLPLNDYLEKSGHLDDLVKARLAP